MIANLFTLHRPLLGMRYADVVLGNGVDFPTIYQARLLLTTSKLGDGAGYNNYSYITACEAVLFARKYCQAGVWKILDHPDAWATLPIADLIKANARGRIMRAIMGSPYCVLYSRMHHAFPEDAESQLRCAALCRLTIKELGLTL
jgi:hypothetical protein